MVAMEMAFPSLGIGFVLRFFEQPFRCAEVVQLGFLNVIDQGAHQFVEQGRFKMEALVAKGCFQFLQRMLVQIVAYPNRSLLNLRINFKMLDPVQEV